MGPDTRIVTKLPLTEICGAMRRWVGLALACALPLLGGVQCVGPQGTGVVLDSRADAQTAVRFFYQPAGNYFHFPLVLMAVEPQDSRLGSESMETEGRAAYISIAEMAELLRRLRSLDLVWTLNWGAESLGPYKDLSSKGVGLEKMQVFVAYADSAAKTNIAPNALCAALAPLDSSLKQPRAIWEFQGFRLNYGCSVPGFKTDAYKH